MSTTAILTAAPAGTWQLDPVHSTVGFEVEYLVGTFKGQFREVEAKLVVGESGASLEGIAKVASVDVKDENLAAHLQSPDFFDAERHPELRFTAEQIDLDGDTITAPGELTMKGITEPVTVTGRSCIRPRERIRERAPRAPRLDQGRSHRVRHQLEHPASHRQAGPFRRGPPRSSVSSTS